MFSTRLIVSLLLFVLITAFWSHHYFKEHPIIQATTTVEALPSVMLFGKKYPLEFHPLTYTGDASPDGNGEYFATIKDVNGQVINDDKDHPNEPYICHYGAGPDHTSLLQKEDQLFSITHLECSIGGAYISKLKQDHRGNLHVQWFKNIDFSAVGGTAVGCAGVTTPWQTHLGSEEYENDMASATIKNPSIAGAHRYLHINPTKQSIQTLGYNQGWITQITPLDLKGNTHVEKHYAMGRFSHELAFVMPDEKTVYLSDDGTNGAFFMFIADEKRNFNAGTLYAAKWEPSSLKDKLATLSWISLGHANQNEIQVYLKSAPRFEELFEKRAFQNGCDEGFRSVNTAKTGPECLKLRPGHAILASRLESRRYAAYLGATTEFKKAEGMAFDASRDRLYLSISVVSSGMEDYAKQGKSHQGYDEGGSNDIQLPYNPCGMILEFTLASDPLRHSDYIATQASPLLEGVPKYYPRPTHHQFNSCDVTTPANPDNISMLADSSYLAIGEDSKGHEKDRLWILNTHTKKLQEVAKAPLGAEFTSTYWHKDIQGYSYLFSVIQHPYGEKDWLVDHTQKAISPSERRSIIGYFGPFSF